MEQSAFGLMLRKLRESRGFSLRELAQLADVDHAYVYRLETGAKEAPSDDVVTKLARALKASRRDAEILRYLGQRANAKAGLVEFALENSTLTAVEFAGLDGMAHRGTVRHDYKTLLERMRRILGEEDGAG